MHGIVSKLYSLKWSRLTSTNIYIAAMLLCVLLTGILPQQLIGALVLVLAIIVLSMNKGYLVFPIMVFYYEALGIIAGMSVYRYFTLMLLLVLCMKSESIALKKRQVLPLCIFIVYALAVVGPNDLRQGIFAIVDIFCVLFLINNYLKNSENVKRFFEVYVFTALCAYVSGTVLNSALEENATIEGEIVQIARNYATFEDPNYAGFFYTIAIFAILSLKLFNPKVRAIIVVALTAVVVTTLSITGLLVNILLWSIYIIAFRKLNVSTMVCILLVVALLVGLYLYGVQNPEAPVIGNFSVRVWEKLQALEQKDMSVVTTKRSELSRLHLELFWAQPVYKMFIGMNPSSTLRIDTDTFIAAAHNEYVDLLLNVGLIGTFIYLKHHVTRVVQCYKGVRKNDEYSSCLFMVKMVWTLYGLALTLFGDYRFMFFFFL